MIGRAGRITAAFVLASVLAVGAAPRPARAASPNFTFAGHGYGHGRGMGQYGALGYALAPYGWSYTQILSHFYGGTVLASTAVTTVAVHLMELDGANSVQVSAPAGQSVVVGGKNTGQPSATVTRSGADTVVTASGGGDLTVGGAWPTGPARAFAGSIVVKASPPQVWNVVGLQQYVEGVVPREMPASWPAAALEAQAVASRSYAVAYTGGGNPAVPICDEGSCQVYGGDPAQYPNGDSSNSNAATVATGNTVLECGSDPSCGSPSTVASAEFSSSTGGYSAGGAFPAVPDAGDATPSNYLHDWTQTVPASTLQSAFPSVGTVSSVVVTARNGLGDYGGRVLSVLVSGGSGRVTITGEQFAADIGLYSDWFTILGSPAPSGSDGGYWVVDSAGAVHAFGDAPYYGSMAGYRLVAPVLGMAPTADGGGYWLVAGDGGVFSLGDARFYGSTGGMRLKAPVLGMTTTADGQGYWLVASDGGVFSFGDARFYGSTGAMVLAKPVVGMAATPDGGGYWLVAADGGVFSFGDARFYGSAATIRLAAPIVGMVPTSDGRGYWLLGSDGGVFTFGDAGFVGSLGGSHYSGIVSVAATPDDRGYLLASAAGAVYTFGDATYFGDPASDVAGWSARALGIFVRP